METEDDNNQENIIASVKVLAAAWFKSIEIVTWQVYKHSKSSGINNFCYQIHRFSKTMFNSHSYHCVAHA